MDGNIAATTQPTITHRISSIVGGSIEPVGLSNPISILYIPL